MSRLPAVTPKQVVNVHNRDVPRGLLQAILKQADLTAEQFLELL